jgi:hypothetical protein
MTPKRKPQVPFKPSVPGRPHHSVIEKHPRRGEIEADIARGVSERVIARKYDISRDVVHRWSKTKIPPQLRAQRYVGLLNATSDLETLRIEESDGLLKNLAMQRARLLLAQDKAIEKQSLMAISYLSAQVHKNLELVGRYLGEFAKHTIQTNVSILIQPEYLRLLSALLQALAPFPEAKFAVVAALHDIEGAAAQGPAPNGHDKAPALIEAQPGGVGNG